jgi:hypothetical protein
MRLTAVQVFRVLKGMNVLAACVGVVVMSVVTVTRSYTEPATAVFAPVNIALSSEAFSEVTQRLRANGYDIDAAEQILRGRGVSAYRSAIFEREIPGSPAHFEHAFAVFLK